MCLCLLPVLYFFSFLYYTDAGSTFWILFTYYLCLNHKYVFSSVAGGVAVYFRQTNIVWIVFMATYAASQHVIDNINPKKKNLNATEFSYLLHVLYRLKTSLLSDRNLIYKLFREVLFSIWPYILIVFGFIGFVLINGSIVVGAKEDHQVSFHLPQLFYFISFSLILSFSSVISYSKLKLFFYNFFNNKALWTIFILLSILAIYFFTQEHQYLLADNRHYTFYVWSKFYRRFRWAQYAYIPAYCYSVWTFSNSLSHKNIIWKCIFIVCVFTNIVPQKLLEFRYFVVPYIIMKLNMKMSTYLQLFIETMFYLAINATTVYLFMNRTFKWDNDNGVQRFMW